MAIHFLDTETTGLYYEQGHEIIEIAIISLHPSGNTTTWHCRIKPMDITAADPLALEINGYNERQWANAQPFEEVANDIACILHGGLVCGQNVQFDMGFIRHQLKKCGVKMPRIRCIDTMVLIHEHLVPIGCQGLSLDAARHYLGWRRTNSHTALVDARDCYLLYKLLIRASVWQRFKLWCQYKLRTYHNKLQ